MPAELVELLPLLTGPASSVGICLLVGYAAWKLLVEKILPQSEARFDKLMSEHKEDRDAFREAVKVLSERLHKVEDAVTDIKAKLKA
jgi:hypothetical protein